MSTDLALQNLQISFSFCTYLIKNKRTTAFFKISQHYTYSRLISDTGVLGLSM